MRCVKLLLLVVLIFPAVEVRIRVSLGGQIKAVGI